MPVVRGLAVTPVKSMRLQRRDEVRLERFGAVGNRQFYVAQPDGRLFENSQHGPLMRIHAAYDPDAERLRLAFPDGSVLEGDATAVGTPVRSSFFGRPVSGRVLEGQWSDRLSRYVGRPLLLVRADAPSGAIDSAPVSLYSVASAEELDRQSAVAAPLDRRRWRMLVEVDGCRPHEEDSWIGMQVRLGVAVVEVTRPVARCVITTKDPETGLRDFDTLRALKEYRGRRDGKWIDFGVYADVVRPGPVRVGDEVEALPR